MAITISSLTPLTPIAAVGTTVTFTVSATTTNAGPLTYLWEFSSNAGASYTSIGINNNTSATFTTGALNQSNNGLYFRVAISDGIDTVYSNEVSEIGNRILTITATPQILVLTSPETSAYTSPVGGTIQLVIEATLTNADITSNSDLLQNLDIQWYGSVPSDIVQGPVFEVPVDEFDYNDPYQSYWPTHNVTVTYVQSSTTPAFYYVRSVLTISNIQFPQNLNNAYEYYALATYPGAQNTPVRIPITNVRIYVNPSITVYKNPGESPDITTIQCYKTTIPNSGELTLSVGALTNSNQPLTFKWEIQFDGVWRTVQYGVDSNWFIIRPGTTSTEYQLQLQRLIYFENCLFRCIVEGSVGETPVTSQPASITFTDVQQPITGLVDVSSVEDRYGDVADRSAISWPTQTATISGSIDKERNTGLNGPFTAQFQRQDAGTTTWYNVGDPIVVTAPIAATYTALPNTVSPGDPLSLSYNTPPLRRDDDHNARYRIQIDSETAGIYYSDEVRLIVYRTAYVLSNPNDAQVFPSFTASFAVDIIPSSGTDITYQWISSSTINGTYSNVTGASYSGQTTNLLTYSNVPLNPTNRFYKVVASVPDQLSSVTTTAGELTIRRDIFTLLPSLNDLTVDQYEQIQFVAEAQSLSLGTILYQWQKSTNFNPNNPNSGTWTNISGQTTDTFTILSAATTDTAYYRVRVTSAGGEVRFSNPARVSVNALSISVTSGNDLPSSITILEGVDGAYLFTTNAVSSTGATVAYQWQIKRPGQTTFSNFGVGYEGSVSTAFQYSILAFDRSDSGAIVRCQLTATGIPDTFYTSQCTVNVDRRFSYFADSAIKSATVGSPFELDLNPTWTGGTPSYQWQRSTNGGSTWSNLTGETSSTYSINSVTAGLNGYQYRCQVTLANVTQHQYSRAGVNYIVSAATTTPTLVITLSTSVSQSLPVYYTRQTEKVGAAIGTVICVAKPPGYVNNTSATTDDVNLWNVAVSGSLTTSSGTASSTTRTRLSWMSSSITYRTAKWTNDRFPGYLELRGQWLLKSDFPALYNVIGDAYGSTSTLFRLPNLYGKKLLGTGNVNNNSGSVSVVPIYGQNMASGGDKNTPGSMGGFYNFTRTRQLPPGSPGVGEDGTANDTFSLGTFNTTGFTESSNSVQPTFQGSVSYTVGPMVGNFLPSVPTHGHSAVSVAWQERRAVVNTNCFGGGFVVPQFPGTQADGGQIDQGPAGIAAANRGILHAHGISINGTVAAGNGNDNHNTGRGSGGGGDTDTEVFSMQNTTGGPTAGMFINSAEVALTNQSRSAFNSGLSFFLRNNEFLPISSPYFRLKYLIKAY